MGAESAVPLMLHWGMMLLASYPFMGLLGRYLPLEILAR